MNDCASYGVLRVALSERTCVERERGRQTDRERERERETDRQTDRQRNRQTDREACTSMNTCCMLCGQ